MVAEIPCISMVKAMLQGVLWGDVNPEIFVWSQWKHFTVTCNFKNDKTIDPLWKENPAICYVSKANSYDELDISLLVQKV